MAVLLRVQAMFHEVADAAPVVCTCSEMTCGTTAMLGVTQGNQPSMPLRTAHVPSCHASASTIASAHLLRKRGTSAMSASAMRPTEVGAPSGRDRNSPSWEAATWQKTRDRSAAETSSPLVQLGGIDV